MRTNPAQLELDLEALLATPAPPPTKTPEELDADLAAFAAEPEVARVVVNPYEVKQAARRERLERGAARARQESERARGAATRIWDAIPMGQPILVGHHSERRHRRDLARADRAMRASIEAHERSRELAARAAAVGTGGISSDDPEAVVKLRAELAGLQRKQSEWKAVNAAIRKHAKAGRSAQQAALTDLGIPRSVASDLLEPDFAGRIGIAAYQLQNNSANMRRIEQRITELTARAVTPARAEIEGEVDGLAFKLVENREANRVQITFADKPSNDVRQRLKAAGFRWAPSQNAWQRQASNGAWFHAQRALSIPIPAERRSGDQDELMTKKKSAEHLDQEIVEYLAAASLQANEPAVSAREFRELLDHAGWARDSLASCQDREVLNESAIARRAAKALHAARLKRPNAELERHRTNMLRTLVRTARSRLDGLS